MGVQPWPLFPYNAPVYLGNALFVQFIREKDRVWRAAHVIIDCKLSTGEMNFEDAVDFLMKHANMEKFSAIAEIKR